MSTNFRDDECRTGQEARVRALREEATRLAGGEVPARESYALSLDARERFWSHVVAIETAPWTTNFQQLVEAGVELPEPESLADAALSAKLCEVIDRLARFAGVPQRHRPPQRPPVVHRAVARGPA